MITEQQNTLKMIPHITKNNFVDVNNINYMIKELFINIEKHQKYNIDLTKNNYIDSLFETSKLSYINIYFNEKENIFSIHQGSYEQKCNFLEYFSLKRMDNKHFKNLLTKLLHSKSSTTKPEKLFLDNYLMIFNKHIDEFNLQYQKLLIDDLTNIPNHNFYIPVSFFENLALNKQKNILNIVFNPLVPKGIHQIRTDFSKLDNKLIQECFCEVMYNNLKGHKDVYNASLMLFLSETDLNFFEEEFLNKNYQILLTNLKENKDFENKLFTEKYDLYIKIIQYDNNKLLKISGDDQIILSANDYDEYKNYGRKIFKNKNIVLNFNLIKEINFDFDEDINFNNENDLLKNLTNFLNILSYNKVYVLNKSDVIFNITRATLLVELIISNNLNVMHTKYELLSILHKINKHTESIKEYSC